MSAGLLVVGVNLRAWEAQRMSAAGEITQFARGLYLRAGYTEEARNEVIRTHGLRIMAYLWPAAAAVGRSAFLKGADQDGKLLIGRSSSADTACTGLDIARLRMEPTVGFAACTLRDEIGEYQANVAVPHRILFDELRSTIPGTHRMQDHEFMALLEDLGYDGDPERFVDRYNQDISQQGLSGMTLLPKDLSALSGRIGIAQMRRTAGVRKSWQVHWYGREIASLTREGSLWNFHYHAGWILPLGNAKQMTPQELPLFIQNTLMEAEGPEAGDQEQAVRHARRAIGHLSIVSPQGSAYRQHESLEGLLRDFTDADTGVFAKPVSLGNEADLQQIYQALKQVSAAHDHPRLSGVQVKIGVNLSATGALTVASGESAMTHILKLSPPGGSRMEALGVKEYMGMRCARRLGLPTPECALVRLAPQGPMSYLVERFDVWSPLSQDRRLIYTEDLCSAMGMPSYAKFDGDMQRVIDCLRSHCTHPDRDLERLFVQVLAGHLIGAGDMHLKNLSLLKRADPTHSRWDQVELSPVYDFFSTHHLPVVSNTVPIAIGSAGREHTPESFMEMGRMIGWDDQTTSARIQRTIQDVVYYVRDANDWARRCLEGSARTAALSDLDMVTDRLESFPDINPQWIEELSQVGPRVSDLFG
jgi:serine/threonine-protein kinase HipA